MENIHARTNHAYIKHMIQNGSKGMKHSDFNEKYEDSCHLSIIGNDFKELYVHLLVTQK